MLPSPKKVLSIVCFTVPILFNNNNDEFMPVSSSDEEIGGVLSMQSGYSAEIKRNGICMEERSVHCKCVSGNPRKHCAGY